MRLPSVLFPLTVLAFGACASTSGSADSGSSPSSSSGAYSKGAGSQGASMASSNGTSDRNASGQDTSSATSCGSCATSTASGTATSEEACWARGWGDGYPTNPDAVCNVKCQTAESGAAPVTVDLRLVSHDFSGKHVVRVDQEGTPGIHREWRTSAVPTVPNWSFRDLTPDGGMYPDGQGEFQLQVQWPFAVDGGPNEDNLQVWSDPARTTQLVNSHTPALRCTMRSN